MYSLSVFYVYLIECQKNFNEIMRQNPIYGHKKKLTEERFY